MRDWIYHKRRGEIRKLIAETKDKKYRLVASIKRGHGEVLTIYRHWLFWDISPVAWYSEAENFILRYDAWKNPRST